MKIFFQTMSILVFSSFCFFNTQNLLAGPPNVAHQPSTGLTFDSPGTEVVSDASGSTYSQKTQTTSEPTNDGAATTTTTTTVKKTYRENKDGSRTDTTETTTETVAKVPTQDGKGDYVKNKSTKNTTTTRKTDQVGRTTTKTTISSMDTEFSEPDEFGNQSVKTNAGKPVKKVTEPNGDTTTTYWTDLGSKIEVTKTRDGKEHSTIYPQGRKGDRIEITENDDGTRTIKHYKGAKRVEVEERVDENDNTIERTEYDRKGSTTYSDYNDNEEPQTVKRKGRDGKNQWKRIYDDDGSYDEIRYLDGIPYKKIYYDQFGEKVEEKPIKPEDRGNAQYAFGDDLGSEGFGAGVVSARDVEAAGKAGHADSKADCNT